MYRRTNGLGYVVIDNPATGAAIAPGKITSRGWAVDLAHQGKWASPVQLFLDGKAVGSPALETPRADVCANILASAPWKFTPEKCPNVGWTFPFDVTAGDHVLRALAADGSEAARAFTVAKAAGGSTTGWFTEQMIEGVPNWGLVAAGGALVLFMMKGRR